MKYIFIAAGGMIGALGRYIVSVLIQTGVNTTFPIGTLSVNLMGSFVIGVLWSIFDTYLLSENLKYLLLIGLLGSFTTFSTFSLETYQMLRESEYYLAAANIIISVLASIVCVFAGFKITGYCFKLLGK